jgi:anaerobic ribonucleoside-triphosphate reductase activating protein
MARIIKYIETTSDGEGVRLSCYFSGCSLACKGCHNPISWDENFGEYFGKEKQSEIIAQLKNMIKPNITLTGGNPLESYDLYEFILNLKKEIPNVNIWIYSGFTIEEIVLNENMFSILKLCDTLVDGRFEIDKKDLTLAYRGSKNQRIIDIKEYLKI